VVEGREGIQFVEARHYAAIFNVRQPADVENKVWAPPPCCEFIAGALYVSIGQAQSFSSLPQTKAWLHQFPPVQEGAPSLQGTTELPVC